MKGRLAGKRILVVEDEYFIASDMKRALQDEDAVVVGPVGRLEQGLALATNESIDGAVLDVNLGQSTTYPIADQLRGAATPWLFVTGYDAWSMPTAYRDAPRLAKPFTMRTVVDTMVQIVTGSSPT